MLRKLALSLLLATPALADQPPQALRPWGDYKIILWLGDSAYKNPARLPAFWASAKSMGVNTGMVHHEGHEADQAGLPYYVENIVNKGLCLKWNSQVRDWDKMVTTWAKTGRPDKSLLREYCLDDPSYLAYAKDEITRVAKKNAPNKPVAYDIRDELSVTMSANPFDYDFGEKSLAGFRTWLKTQYADLPALNAEWATRFSSWDEVRPFTTDQIKNRLANGTPDAKGFPRGKPDWQALQKIKFSADALANPAPWNFSPWCDFRTYNDLTLARTLGDIRAASHAADPATPVGIEGTQMPSAWGGYDLSRLARSVDWVEPYDIAGAHAIFASFMPGQPLLTTVGESDPKAARRRLWHLLLEGDKGCIIWWSEDTIDTSKDDGGGCPLTAKGQALAPVLKEMTSPLAALFMRAEKEFDPVYIHYSQPSIQVDWLLESTVDGSTWLRRFSSYEADHNRQAHARTAWLQLLQDLGYSPRFISTDQIESGQLAASGARVLVLPTAWSLSDKEAQKIRDFLAGPNTVLADGTPGLFDSHGKLRPKSPLADQFPFHLPSETIFAKSNSVSATFAGDIAKYGTTDDTLAFYPFAADPLPIKPPVTVALPPDPLGPARPARTRIHRFTLGPAQLLAFERNIPYHMSEDLKQKGDNAALETPLELQATLPAPAYIYDLRTGKPVGGGAKSAAFRFPLDPFQPALFATTPEPIPTDPLTYLQAQSNR